MSEPIDVEIISEEKIHPMSEHPCPIDIAFREVHDTLTDFRVPDHVHETLESNRADVEELYHTGETIVNGVQKTIPKLRALFDKVSESGVFLGRREMMKRGL